jgi:hypothetical protein
MATGKKQAGAGTRKATGGTKKAVPGKKTASKSRSKGRTKAQDSGSDTGMEQSLGHEAHTVMRAQASKIAGDLLRRSMLGNLKSAQMLVGLSETEAEAKEALDHGPLRSQALEWAAEPQWQDEVDAEKAEAVSASEEVE